MFCCALGSTTLLKENTRSEGADSMSTSRLVKEREMNPIVVDKWSVSNYCRR
jgi:hypothetical protein